MPNAEIFDFDKRVSPIKWYVDGLISSGTLSFLLGKSRAGKSFLVNYLANCTVYAHDFIDREVEPSDVLLIDEDTPTETLERRLLSFGNYMESENYRRMHKLYVASQKGLSLSDESLIDEIAISRASVVIIDSLISVAGDLDINKTKDMAKALSEIKRTATKFRKTLIVTHHISEHANVTSDEIMADLDVPRLTMGNSAINQAADNLVFCSSTTNSDLKFLNIRAVPKRYSLNDKPFTAELVESRDKSERHFEYMGIYEPSEELYEIDTKILRLFTKTEPSFRQVYQITLDMGSEYDRRRVGESVKKLSRMGFLRERRRSQRTGFYGLSSWKDSVEFARKKDYKE